MKYFPINLDLKGKKCLVVGGGRVAERRVLSLLECEADVTIISPRITPSLEKLSDMRKINHKERAYKPGDIRGAYIVIASTDNQNLNRQIGDHAKKVGALVNIVSEPGLSDFTVPGILRRGDLLVTISTSGASPTLSKRLKAELENILGKEYEIFTSILRGVRTKFLSLPVRKRRLIYSQVAMSEIPKLLREKRYKKAERELMKITGLTFNDILL
jgi:precorrin-2 dehydrogenase/sirohydrochlorin ferrochelatase